MSLDIYALGNALLDIEIKVSDDDFKKLQIDKGAMTLIDKERLTNQLSALKSQNLTLTKQAGGSAANTVYAASQLGCNCAFSGKIGYDDAGDLFKVSLLDADVTPLLSNPKEDLLTGTCFAYIHDDAQRSFETYLGASSFFSHEDLDLEALHYSKIVYCEGFLFSNGSAFQALLSVHDQVKGALALTLSDIFMVTSFKDRFISFLEKGKLSYLFCNDAEALAFVNDKDLTKAIEVLSQYTETLIITLGKKGCLIHQHGKTFSIEGKAVKALNTNGAGDAFAGAFLASILQDYTLDDAAKRANEAAAVVVQQAGPRFQGFS